jgi:hypothetical protein
VLLTRSPLEHPRKGLSARLACVKHAASVRPEPGSNSPTKTLTTKNNKQTQKHWHTKHPVEFSKNNHTPQTTPTKEPPTGHSFYSTVSRWHRQPVSPGSRPSDPVRPTTQHAAYAMSEVEGLGRTAAAVSPLARPFPCRTSTLPAGLAASKSPLEGSNRRSSDSRRHRHRSKRTARRRYSSPYCCATSIIPSRTRLRSRG